MTLPRPLAAATALAAAALFATACGSAGGTASSVSPRPEPASLARVQNDTLASPDSAAQWLRRGCRGGESATCVERTLLGVLSRSGVARAMAVLDALAEADADMRREAHALAHGLGVAAYRDPQTVAEVFAACPNTQIAGCYHGVIQGYFLDAARRTGGVSAEAMNTLCAPHRARSALYFQCTHGMGHGLMALNHHQVPAALQGCDQITEAGARDSCYGGVFMENIVGETHPHSTAESHLALVEASGAHAGGEHAGHGDAADAHAGHGAAPADSHAGHEMGMNMSADSSAHAGHGASAAAGTWKPLDRDDPLYPCTAVGERYQYQCYLIQTAAILPATHGDIAATARICAGAPARMVQVCYASLGRDLTSYAARDPARTAALCARAGEAAEPGCVRGAAVSLVDVAANPADGLALCAQAKGAALKSPCYEAVGGAMLGVTPEPARREALCAAVEADYVQLCRKGARLAVTP
jgi:hypothetical protein